MQCAETTQVLFQLLQEREDDIRAHHAEQLWQSVVRAQANPLTTDTHAVFLYWGDAETVQLAGDWTFWQPSAPLQRIAHTKLFYTVLEFPLNARLQYKIIVDGNWQLDPANARVVEEGFGYNNEFWMPAYVDRSLLEIGRTVAVGMIEPLPVESSILNGHRQTYMYVPQCIPKPSSANLLIVHDGAEAIRLGKFPRILDHLHALQRIAPTVACFLVPHDRNSEYALSKDYVRFTALELVSAAKEYFQRLGIAISEDAESVAITGASLGGLLATKTALEYYNVIGKVLAQSPSYWWNRGEIFRSRQLRHARYLHVVIQTGMICDARELSSLMARRLRSFGGRVDYFEYAQGHTWGNWRSTFAEGIMTLFPFTSSITE